MTIPPPLSVIAPYPAPCGVVGKSRGASPLPLRRASVPAPVCAALVCWMSGFGGGCNENAPTEVGASGLRIQIFLKMSNVSEVPTAM